MPNNHLASLQDSIPHVIIDRHIATAACHRKSRKEWVGIDTDVVKPWDFPSLNLVPPQRKLKKVIFLFCSVHLKDHAGPLTTMDSHEFVKRSIT